MRFWDQVCGISLCPHVQLTSVPKLWALLDCLNKQLLFLWVLWKTKQGSISLQGSQPCSPAKLEGASVTWRVPWGILSISGDLKFHNSASPLSPPLHAPWKFSLNLKLEWSSFHTADSNSSRRTQSLLLLQHILSKLITVMGDLKADFSFGGLGKVLTACFHRVGLWNMEKAKMQL